MGASCSSDSSVRVQRMTEKHLAMSSPRVAKSIGAVTDIVVTGRSALFFDVVHVTSAWVSGKVFNRSGEAQAPGIEAFAPAVSASIRLNAAVNSVAFGALISNVTRARDLDAREQGSDFFKAGRARDEQQRAAGRMPESGGRGHRRGRGGRESGASIAEESSRGARVGTRGSVQGDQDPTHLGQSRRGEHRTHLHHDGNDRRLLSRERRGAGAAAPAAAPGLPGTAPDAAARRSQGPLTVEVPGGHDDARRRNRRTGDPQSARAATPSSAGSRGAVRTYSSHHSLPTVPVGEDAPRSGWGRRLGAVPKLGALVGNRGKSYDRKYDSRHARANVRGARPARRTGSFYDDSGHGAGAKRGPPVGNSRVPWGELEGGAGENPLRGGKGGTGSHPGDRELEAGAGDGSGNAPESRSEAGLARYCVDMLHADLDAIAEVARLAARCPAKVFPASHSVPRMTTVADLGGVDDGVVSLCKGEARSVLPLCAMHIACDGRAAPLTMQMRLEIEQLLDSWTAEGDRALCVAERDLLTVADGEGNLLAAAGPAEIGGLIAGTSREEAERDMTLVAVLRLRVPLRPGVRLAAYEGRHLGFAVRFATSLPPSEAVAVATLCGLVQPGELAHSENPDGDHVFHGYSDAVLAGEDVRQASPQRCARAMVLAEASPIQIAMFVSKLRGGDNTVACLAAHPSFAPALMSADVAAVPSLKTTREGSADLAPFAHAVLDRDLPGLLKSIRIAREGADPTTSLQS